MDQDQPRVPLHITIEVPSVLVDALRCVSGDPAHVAVEALSIALYRDGRITLAQLGEALGLDRHETSALLRHRRVFEGSLTRADLEAERAALTAVLGPTGTRSGATRVGPSD